MKSGGSAVAPSRSVALAAVLLATFLAAMEATVVATAMPTVVAELGGLELYGWVGAAYTLASVVAMPLAGKLADSLGRRPAMLGGLAVFLVGSAASGMSQTMGALIGFRVLQGLGAGAIQPISLTIVGDLYAPEERGRIQGLFGALWGMAGMVGPLLGGLLVHVLSWRWVFFVNVPAGVLAVALFLGGFRESGALRPARLDVAGALTLTLAIVALLLASSRIEPFLTAPASAALAGVFLVVESRAKEPIVPLGLYRQRVVATASVASVLLGAVMMGSLLYAPLYAQGVRGASPTEAGVLLTPMLVGWPLAATVGSRFLPRFGYRPLVRFGGLFAAVGSVLLAVAVQGLVGEGSAARVLLGTGMFGIGVGMGLANTALLIAVQASVPFESRGVATAGAMFSRTTGGAVAAGALGALVAARLGPDVPPSVVNALLGPEHGRLLAPEQVAPLQTSLRAGLAQAFWAIAGLGVLGFGAGLLFPKLRLEDRVA